MREKEQLEVLTQKLQTKEDRGISKFIDLLTTKSPRITDIDTLGKLVNAKGGLSEQNRIALRFALESRIASEPPKNWDDYLA